MYANVSPGFDQHEQTATAGGTAGGRVQDLAATPAERTYATFTHLSLLAVHVLIPVLPALVMWLIKRHESPFLDDHGKEAVNFQISLVIYFGIAFVLTFLCIGYPLLLAVYGLGIVGMIMAAMAANRGEFYRYPACIRVVA